MSTVKISAATLATLTPEVRAQVEAIQADNEAKAAKLAAKVKPISFKVSEEKKALSVYGLGRFPCTMYAQQWLRLLDPQIVDELKAFIVAHAGELASKE